MPFVPTSGPNHRHTCTFPDESGKQIKARRWQNPDGSTGGWVGHDAIVADSVMMHPTAAIWPKAIVGESAILGAGSVVGPDAILKPGQVLAEKTQAWAVPDEGGRIITVLRPNDETKITDLPMGDLRKTLQAKPKAKPVEKLDT